MVSKALLLRLWKKPLSERGSSSRRAGTRFLQACATFVVVYIEAERSRDGAFTVILEELLLIYIKQ